METKDGTVIEDLYHESAHPLLPIVFGYSFVFLPRLGERRRGHRQFFDRRVDSLVGNGTGATAAASSTSAWAKPTAILFVLRQEGVLKEIPTLT